MKLESSVTLFDDNKVEDRFAELQITADGITSEVSRKVGNDEVISRINQSAESVTINANKVNIEGAAIFSSGRLSQSSLNNAYDANGAATSSVNNLKSDLSSSSGTTVINGGHIATGSMTIGALDTNAQNTIDNAGKTASSFITPSGNTGITVHAINNPTSNYAQIDSDGMKVYKGGSRVASFGGSSIDLGENSLTSVINMCKSTLKMKSKYTSIYATNDCTTTSIAAGDSAKDYNVLEVGMAVPDGAVGDVATDAKLMFETQNDGDYVRTVLTGRDSIDISLLGSAITSIGISPSDTWGYGDVDISGLKSLRLSSSTSDFTASLWYMGGAPTTGSQSYNAIWTKSGDDYRLGRPSSSSRRYKEDIKPVENEELDPHRLYDIPVVQFKFKEDYFDESDPYNDDRYDVVGFIAEDVLEHYPRAAIVIDGEVENWNERYMLPPMLKLIQEQKKKIDELEERIEALERKIK